VKKSLFLIILLPAFIMANILQNAIDEAAPNSILRLKNGVYKGNIIINKPITIIGKGKNVVIDGDLKLSVITIKSSNVTIKNLKIINSGDRHYSLDSGITAREAKNILIENCLITNTLFGINFEKVNHSKLLNNKIISKSYSMGIRGDGIKLWYSNNNIIKGNSVLNSKDVLLAYSNYNLIEGNIGKNSRYSLHLMYSFHNIIRKNKYTGNSVGIFLMYSSDALVEQNIIKNSLGVTGVAIGLKETGNTIIKNNILVYNTTGISMDRSPDDDTMPNFIENNEIANNRVGIKFLNICENLTIEKNNFEDNLDQIDDGDAISSTNSYKWRGNYWDDYKAFDRNSDLIGDSPYTLYNYLGDFYKQNDTTRFFYGSAATTLILFIHRLIPFSKPKLILEDKHPSMIKFKIKG